MSALALPKGKQAVRDYRVDCCCYGVPFQLRARSAEMLERMIAEVPHGTSFQEQAGGQAGEIVCFEETADLQGLRTALMVHVANFAPDHVFLHAGVVSWQGKGIVLPGSSFAGKTTLVAALVHAGCRYYSDEYAVIAPDGQVWPYSRNLQVRVPGRPEQTSVDVGKLGGESGTGPLHVVLVAMLRYEPSVSLRLKPVSPGMAVLEMLRHSIPVQRTPARVLASLTTLVSHARCVQATRGEATETAEALIAMLEKS